MFQEQCRKVTSINLERDERYISMYYEKEKNRPIRVPDLEKTALLFIDLQNEFVSLDCGEAVLFKELGVWEKWKPFFERVHQVVIPNSKKLLNFFRENNLEVTHARIATLKTDGKDRSLVQKRGGVNEFLVHIESEGAQIVNGLQPEVNEIVISKTTDSVTSGTAYVPILRNMGIDTIIVAGIITEQCVASSVRALADEGFNLILVEDCCASGDQELHDYELRIMNYIYCDVLSSNQVIDVMKQSVLNKSFEVTA